MNYFWNGSEHYDETKTEVPGSDNRILNNLFLLKIEGKNNWTKLQFTENDKRRISISFPDVVKEFWPEDTQRKKKQRKKIIISPLGASET